MNLVENQEEHNTYKMKLPKEVLDSGLEVESLHGGGGAGRQRGLGREVGEEQQQTEHGPATCWWEQRLELPSISMLVRTKIRAAINIHAGENKD